MKQLADKIAVITGGASGIGQALAVRLVAEGARVVLVDIETGPLAATESMLRSMGGDVLAVEADVARKSDVEGVATQTLERFGGVDLLFNNAGVGSPPGVLWERTADDWSWVFGVNVFGVVYGIEVFVPIMLAQARPAHIVNTASMAGLLSGPFLGIYNASKHAVVALSETLAAELETSGVDIGVSILCPGVVRTNIARSERNRPGTEGAGDLPLPAIPQGGIEAEAVAEMVIEAIRERRRFIVTHAEHRPHLRAYWQKVLGEQVSVAQPESRAERIRRLRLARSGGGGRSRP